MKNLFTCAICLLFLGACNTLSTSQSTSSDGEDEATENENQSEAEAAAVRKPVGYMQLIEFHDDIQGVLNWAYELQERGLTSLVNVQAPIIEAYPEEIQWLAEHGHEIMGGFSGGALWDVPYEEQLAGMQEAKDAGRGRHRQTDASIQQRVLRLRRKHAQGG